MDLKSELIPTLLGQAQFPAFSPNLEVLEACTDGEELYELLLLAMEREPYLLAKFVTRANSVLFGIPGGHFFTPRDCLARLGLTEGLHLALSFYLEDALGPFIRANKHCVATWREARVAAQLTKHLGDQCTDDFGTGAAFLTTALSYVGEMFVLGCATTSETTNIDLGFYGAALEDRVDVFHISSVIINKLQLPQPVARNFRDIKRVVTNSDPFSPNAGAVLLARLLAQRTQPPQVPVSQVSLDVYETLVRQYPLSEQMLTALSAEADTVRASTSE